MRAADTVKRAALNKAIDYLMEDPERNLPHTMDLINKYFPTNLFNGQRQAFSDAINTQNNWYQLLMKITKLNPEVIPHMMKTFIVDDNIIAWGIQERNREKYECNIPWAIIMDPTSACNLRCTGCWAAEYGHNLSLDMETMESIIKQGTELGCYIYLFTGGEPLVRKADVIKLCENHPECMFLCFTNSTLIDEAFCQEMIRVKNFIPAISVEGFEEATDSRRGDGVFQKVSDAMDLLRSHQLPFGVSVCYTCKNFDSICSEEFFDWMVDKGVLFAWFFTFMPIGRDTSNELMATAEQREKFYYFIRDMRHKKPLFTLDFWNDGEYTGGCIAGGRRYLHINARGDVEPCVFAHYSNVNIHDVSLLDALRSPLFMAYRANQPFDGNYLRPCPILDNPYRLEKIVEETGAYSTDLPHEEDAHDLCAKCDEAAHNWYPVANKLWHDPNDPRYPYRQKENLGQAGSDVEKFEELGKKDPYAEATLE